MSFRSAMLRFYWPMERVITPGLRPSQYRYYEVVREYVSDAQWLDLGCGHSVFGSWMREEQHEVISLSRQAVGIDVESEGLRQHPDLTLKCVANAFALPFGDETFSLVTANMVVEHVEEPETILREVARVLRPGGVFVFHTPNRIGYSTLAVRFVPEAFKRPLIRLLDGRRSEDVFQTHYRLNRPSDVRRHAANAGLNTSRIEMTCSSATSGVIPFVAPFELILVRILRTKTLAQFRPVMIAVLKKPIKVQDT